MDSIYLQQHSNLQIYFFIWTECQSQQSEQKTVTAWPWSSDLIPSESSTDFFQFLKQAIRYLAENFLLIRMGESV